MRVRCDECKYYNHAEDDYSDFCEECSEYLNYGERGCKCMNNPPCDYCVGLKFERLKE